MLTWLALALADTPVTTSVQGSLADAGGAPLNGDHLVTIRLWTAETSGTALVEETGAILFSGGAFATRLGTSGGLTVEELAAAPAVWMELQLATGGPSARVPVGQALYAAVAHRAQVAATAEAVGAIPAANVLHTGSDLAWSRLVGVPALLTPTSDLAWSRLTGVPALLTPTSDLDWTRLTNLPSWASTGYSAGTGIALNGSTFSLTHTPGAGLSLTGSTFSVNTTAVGDALASRFLPASGPVDLPANTTVGGQSLSAVISGAAGVPRTVSGFVGDLGPDLSSEGYTQCFGWSNDGYAPNVGWSGMRTACGAAEDILFAGYRAGGYTLVRHPAELVAPLLTFLPATLPSVTTYNDYFDMEGKYTFATSPDGWLLGRHGNRWADPGRLWLPCHSGTAGCNGWTGYAGHVLSTEGNDAHDQYNYTGDRYFVYYRPKASVSRESCATYLAANPGTSSGPRDLKLDGVNPTRVYCDMTDGGWTLVANQVSSSVLPDEMGNVNVANFGTTNTSWRIGQAVMREIRPAVAWRMNDSATNVFFKPVCRVDWGRGYVNTARSYPCNTGYTSVAFSAITNGAFVDAAVRGIGINNSGTNCSIRMYNQVAWNSLPIGAAVSCNAATNVTIQLWFK